ncbi:MAG: DUF5134 domain-containing protein [Actinomycetota bacterium]|nr:DUF5134 domain-containing protein [Actinomycetota bacterium]
MDMSMPVLPMWVQVSWVVALVVAIVTHLRHVYGMSGQHRWWVLGHVAMATAMIPMYMPRLIGGNDFSPLGLRLFISAAFVVAGASIVMRYRENVLNPLWVMLTVDLAIMAYMWLPTTSRPSMLDGLLAVYYVYQAVAWMLGLWDRIPVLDRSMPGGRHSPRPAPTVAVVGLTTHTSLAGRATLAVMAASMGYMLVAM